MMIPCKAADVAEPVAVLVAFQLADELSAAGSEASIRLRAICSMLKRMVKRGLGAG
jgi:hypothetical protein